MISFIIPVRDDADRLRRCLQSILATAHRPGSIEILVADNGSTDASASVARSVGARVLSLAGVRLGEVRNRAAALAIGEILAFVDADHEVGPEWVAAAGRVLADPDVAAAGAPYHPPTSATWVQTFYDRLRFRPSGTRDVEWLGSGNLAIRREAFLAIGGFDPTLETCEDVDVCRKLRATGRRLVSDDALYSVHHGDPKTLRHVFFGELWRGRDNLRVSLRPPRTWRTLASAAIPAVNLLALVVATAGLVAAGIIGWMLPALAFAALVTLILLRASRMTRGASRDLPRAFAVAFAYELGRALALATRVGHGRRRAGVATS